MLNISTYRNSRIQMLIQLNNISKHVIFNYCHNILFQIRDVQRLSANIKGSFVCLKADSKVMIWYDRVAKASIKLHNYFRILQILAAKIAIFAIS